MSVNGTAPLKVFCVVCALWCTASVAQVPGLPPKSTVNPATGEMGFRMELGVVKGANGGDFPIELHYKAGIRTEETASAVGLGFGVGPGGISRKVVHIPDDITGPSGLEYHRSDPECFVPRWKLVLAGIIEDIVTVVFMLLGPAAESSTFLSVTEMIVNTMVELALQNSLLLVDPQDYRTGGDHTPAYDYAEGDRTGFLYGGKQDSPDIYTVRTPYLSGQMVWVGGPDDGHFALRTGNGGSLAEANAVAIKYDRTADTFVSTPGSGSAAPLHVLVYSLQRRV